MEEGAGGFGSLCKLLLFCMQRKFKWGSERERRGKVTGGGGGRAELQGSCFPEQRGNRQRETGKMNIPRLQRRFLVELAISSSPRLLT